MRALYNRIMKKVLSFIVFLMLCSMGTTVHAQDEVEATLEADVVSQFIWRGLDNGHVSLQPTFGIAWKGLSVSAWGNVGITDSKDATEIDLELSYTIGGLTLRVTDYWTDDNPKYFDYHTDTTAHYFEGGVGYDFGVLSLSWQTIFAGCDLQETSGKRAFSSYAEVVVPFNLATCQWEATVGAVPFKSDFYSTNGFRVTNLSLKATKDLQISEKFALPLFGQLVANPNARKMFFVFGLTIGI